MSTRPKRAYDASFKVTDAYRASLPDVMKCPNDIEGARVAIQQVGIDGFKLPMRFALKAGSGKKGGAAAKHDTGPVTLEARVTGTVSLDAARKGINMSRIVRTFYEHCADVCSPESLGRILKKYRRVHAALEARLRVAFSFPVWQASLRSGLGGWQYYDAAYEVALGRAGELRRYVEMDFEYSSACPCSAELAEHAREARGVFAMGHSQRSRARVRVEIAPRRAFTVDTLREHCRAALRTETQVMVKREDEQAFAELNGAHLKFVEDAARLLYARLAADARVRDFRVICAHYESLHSHDAVSVICKGIPGGMNADSLDFRM
ncbi:GTP cyclohydrolase FolE2 [Ereboglobus luteus]|uniref:GTP cyclohydrolase I FolE2 n=1 Tax=Ereboglobus luteus TaxID=1796921 RepID=A0A2U8E704_9BACT|nr:GTP cyclohydrolase FolE2 [Ereboglobus luteus]AWI10623.1 GTP cyclohydrolase I FolE2 [Ereboglobus luteus]